MNNLQKTATAVTIAMTTTFVAANSGAAEVTFEGETVEWIVPFSEGGGSDEWARFYAPLLSEALPGQPPVVIKNMPGAGSTKGANWFADRAKPDGLTILGTSGSTQFPYMLDDPRVDYEYSDWNVVLASGFGGVAYLPADISEQWRTDPQAVIDNELLIYGSNGAARIDLVALLAWEMLGLQVDPIFGTRGRGDGRLMFERGEATIDWQATPAYLSNVVPLVEQGIATPFMTFGSLGPDGEIIRDPILPDVPTFKEEYERVHGEAPSGPAWEAWKAFFIAGFPGQKMVFLPKDTPQDITDAFSAAFADVAARPDFAEISANTLGGYPQTVGAEAQSRVELGTKVDPDAKAWVKAWLKERFGVDL